MIWRKDVECLEPKELKVLQSERLKQLIPFIGGRSSFRSVTITALTCGTWR